MRLLIFIFFFITSCSNDMNIESFSKNEFIVGARDSCVSILELARQNKKRMALKDFYNGARNFLDDSENFSN